MTEEQKQQIGIQKLFTKDISFENPNSPFIFKDKWKPEVSVELNNKSLKLDDQNYEVVLSITVTIKTADKVACLAEVHQAGIFLIKGFDEKTINEILGNYCLSILFPYSRETISELIQKGGFQPFYLQPVDFNALYAQKLQQQQKDEGKTKH
ncbi:MAG: protein-export chaperone SecB [Gammaproteobacteria bacterium]|nr:MAG: protein-export chaperone SecB [Gammaproteobacteria bacterium]